jgi:protein tyrosine/serine phosphatase
MQTGIDLRQIVTRMSRGWPAPVRARLGPFGDWLDMMVVDHGFVRLVRLNLHRTTPNLWRSAQPSPGTIEMLARRGLKTVINLRGANMPQGSRLLEAEACRKHGVALVEIPITSRSAPVADSVVRLVQAFDTIAYPALIHCKSGSDRAGLAAALYLHVHEDKPLAEARRQLSLRYGHVRAAKTGVLDHFLDEYEKDHAATGRSLIEWICDPAYDARAMTMHFRTNIMANMLVDWILRRE